MEKDEKIVGEGITFDDVLLLPRYSEVTPDMTIPACVTGGVSLILYGFIAASGVKMLIADQIDFGETKNIFVASVILVAGIGGLAFKFGDAANPIVEITSIAVSMILGIIMTSMKALLTIFISSAQSLYLNGISLPPTMQLSSAISSGTVQSNVMLVKGAWVPQRDGVLTP